MLGVEPFPHGEVASERSRGDVKRDPGVRGTSIEWRDE
jgi:hypothetical protein